MVLKPRLTSVAEEANGKSNNLNNCLKNVIYAHTKDGAAAESYDHTKVPSNEVVVVLDCDMVAKPDFLLKVSGGLVGCGSRCVLCLVFVNLTR